MSLLDLPPELTVGDLQWSTVITHTCLSLRESLLRISLPAALIQNQRSVREQLRSHMGSQSW
jgi:hypothetical protein